MFPRQREPLTNRSGHGQNEVHCWPRVHLTDRSARLDARCTDRTRQKLHVGDQDPLRGANVREVYVAVGSPDRCRYL
jgi:hypothetical protein